MDKKANPGRTLEILTARIEAALSGSNVVVKSPDYLEDKVAGGTREVDVSLRTTVGSAEVVLIVECRDRGRAADITWIEQVAKKRDAVGAAKAIAISSGTFSKKAITAAAVYGIDARTLAQVNRAEVKRWTGSISMFEETASIKDLQITIALAGDEPLRTEDTQRFDQLVADKNLDAAFIAFIGREGLLSPMDVIKQRQIGGELPKGKTVKVMVPAKSSFVISNNPAFAMLVADAPRDGSYAPREHTIAFPDEDAFLCMEGTAVWDTRTSNRLCLLAAFAINLVSTQAYAREGYPPYLVLSEAIGLTLVEALPAFIGQLWLKQPRVYHASTLALAVLVTYGEYYGRTHP